MSLQAARVDNPKFALRNNRLKINYMIWIAYFHSYHQRKDHRPLRRLGQSTKQINHYSYEQQKVQRSLNAFVTFTQWVMKLLFMQPYITQNCRKQFGSSQYLLSKFEMIIWKIHGLLSSESLHIAQRLHNALKINI